MCCFTYVINYQIKPVELKKMIVYIMSFTCRYKPFWSSFLMLIKRVCKRIPVDDNQICIPIE